jgi:large subunit ribosomal protein L13
LYQRSLKEQQAQDPTSLISKAIRGMLPVNKLRDQRLARLKIYEGADHNHAAQKPEEVKLRGRNNGK